MLEYSVTQVTLRNTTTATFSHHIVAAIRQLNVLINLHSVFCFQLLKSFRIKFKFYVMKFIDFSWNLQLAISVYMNYSVIVLF